MKSLKIFLLFIFIFPAALFASESNNADLKDAKHVKYIFLMIGDGMGSMQRHCAETYKKSKSSAPGKTKLTMNSFPVTGTTGTLNVNGQITDSAAAGTALACGEKTQNKFLGIGPLGKHKLKSIAYDAQECGMKVGVISSVPVDHATPAAFYATVPMRNMYYQIAMSIPECKFDFLAGSGSLGERQAKNKISPIKAAEEKGYTVIKDKKNLLDLEKSKPEKILSICELKYATDIESDNDLTLAELTNSAIGFLDNPKGFFLMVEGGKIDWSCHRNDSAECITETMAFDDAVNVAYEFYLKHPDETLIVVTADHETGGMLQGKNGKEKFDKKTSEIKIAEIIDKQKISIEKFYSKYISKWKKDKSSFDKVLMEIKDKLGLDNLTENEVEKLKKAFEIYTAEKSKSKRSPELIKMYGSKNPVAIECSRIISDRCGITWTSFGHSKTPVTTTAIGKDSEFFSGKYENTNICRILRAAITSTKK
jgi:alkaline phosphatase